MSTIKAQLRLSGWTPHAIKQLIKWIVYTVLIINFGFYIWEDWQFAGHTLRGGGSAVQWAAAFTTSNHEIAWFVLLALSLIHI